MGREGEEHPETRDQPWGRGRWEAEKGRVETSTQTQTQARLFPTSPPRAPPQNKQTRTFFSNVIFPLILGSVSPCVWLSSCPASRLLLSPTLYIFLKNLPLLLASGRP